MSGKGKKRILFINGNLNIGGVEKSLLTILQNMDFSNYEVDLLLLERGGVLINEVPSEVNVIYKNIQKAYGPITNVILECIKQRDFTSIFIRLIILLVNMFGQRNYSILKYILNLDRYDTCIGFRPGICSKIALYCITADKKILWWHHGLVNVTDEYEIDAGRSDFVIVVSKYCKKILIDKFPQIKSKVKIIPNMIDEDRLLRYSNEYVPDFSNEKLRIVMVGNPAYEKRYDIAVHCAAHLKCLGYDVGWYLIGNGPMISSLKNEVLDRELDQNFHFLGEIQNPYPYISNADLFVHPSFIEAQGISILEALTFGIPVIITESGGPEEFVINNVNGLISKKDSDCFVEKVVRIVKDSSLRMEIKKKCSLPSDYSVNQIMKRIEEII